MTSTLEKELDVLEPRLASIYLAIAKGAAYVADFLRISSETLAVAGSKNTFGDAQLQADVRADLFMFDCLKMCGHVEVATSEEQTEMKYLGGSGYSVAFDPLDGSSIIGANWAVGSIFGIWPGYGILGKRVKDQAGAAYCVYGPRTVLVIARPCPEGDVVQEFTLAATGKWLCTNPKVWIGEKKMFAPANLRAAAGNKAYKELIDTWIAERSTLRYSGGLCSDVHHILAKGGGVFCNPAAPDAPAKLRLAYECAALAVIVEAAGGASHDGTASLMERVVDSVNTKTVIALGSKVAVRRCMPCLQASL